MQIALVIGISIVVALYFAVGEIFCKKLLLRKAQKIDSPEHIKKRLHWVIDKFSPAKEFYKSIKAILDECGTAFIKGIFLGVYGLACIAARLLYLLLWPIHLLIALRAINREFTASEKSDEGENTLHRSNTMPSARNCKF